jgi:hypothetical protein
MDILKYAIAATAIVVLIFVMVNNEKNSNQISRLKKQVTVLQADTTAKGAALRVLTTPTSDTITIGTASTLDTLDDSCKTEETPRVSLRSVYIPPSKK